MKLLAIDLSNLIARHYHSPGGRDHDQDGRPLYGVCGSIRQTISLIRQEQPTHLLIARDNPRADNYRRDIDARYKAHRPDSDDDMTRQFELAYQAMTIMNWPLISYPRHEADDVIASASHQNPGETLIVSGDKDMLALCTERTTVGLLRPGGVMDKCGPDGCYRYLQVHPQQVQDYKALAGDNSDGIPGIQGIGAKTAVELLARYGTLGNVYKQLDHETANTADGEQVKLEGVKPGMIKKLIAGREEARVSWRLAAMVKKLPVNFDAMRTNQLTMPADHRQQLTSIGLAALAG